MSISSGEITVLHVEDDQDLADLAKTFIEDENQRISIESAAHADEGLERFNQEGYDCIVSDYDMPGKTGIEFLRIIREENEAIPFILFTGKGSEEVASEAIAAGVTDYLQKGAGSEVYSLLTNRITNAVEQYRSKKVQQETQERYQTLVEDSPNPIALHRDEIVYANAAMVEMLGAKGVSEIQGRHPRDVIHPDYHDRFEEHFDRVMNGQPLDGAEMLMNRLDGETRYVEAYGGQVQYGGKSAVQIVLRDITEWRKRERELRRTKRAVDAAAHAIYITDADGEIQYVNPAFEDITGYERAEAIGETPGILNSGQMADEYFEELWESILSGESWEETIVNSRKDGTPYRARQSIAPVKDDQGQIEGFVAIQKDIDEGAPEP